MTLDADYELAFGKPPIGAIIMPSDLASICRGLSRQLVTAGLADEAKP
jgi:hypothetical protein